MTIDQIYQIFPSRDDCLSCLEQVRWNRIPICPYCHSAKQTPLTKEHRYHCNTCNTSYSVTVGTIFHKTHVDLRKWFLAISLITNPQNGITTRQLARTIAVNKNTAWYMTKRIKKARVDNRELLLGIAALGETRNGSNPKGKK